jgi:hypothetical protein
LAPIASARTTEQGNRSCRPRALELTPAEVEELSGARGAIRI